ncbi:hypothetical protein Tsubulata_030783 [Turnera subulata]|uniref:GCVT N-terminal domain-containing protein n=1 Tax=Turnera subulata TaxID=218843 RepID=A0A9Q0FLE3_9ROSI|nr:hypothetical protein Tsubulata_030783 [Turnera subulata]
MDPEQTFIRVQERFSQMLTPKVRAALEYIYLFIAVTLFCILVVMHANYVQQPGCSSEFSGVEAMEAQLIQIKITSAGLWSRNESESNAIEAHEVHSATDKLEIPNVNEEGLTFSDAKFWFNWMGSGAKKGKLAIKFGKTDTEYMEQPHDSQTCSGISKPVIDDAVSKTDKVESRSSFSLSAKETLKAAMNHFGKKWHRRLLFIWRHAMQIVRGFQKLWNITGIRFNLDVPKWLRILYLDRLNSYAGSWLGNIFDFDSDLEIITKDVYFLVAVQWLEKKSKGFEPTYLYTMEKGFFLLPEEAKSRHNIRTVNISLSARHPCFGNRWQQLLINRIVGYDTILMNSLLTSPGQGYLFNFQTKEFYNLSYAQEPPEGPAKFGDYLVTKCGVLMMSLFVFFTTTMSVSFTLRETQTRMLKFTVQLQHHARHRLPTFQLIFVHVIESLVFVPCPHANLDEVLSAVLFALFSGFSHLLLFLCLRLFVFGSLYNCSVYAASYLVLLEPVPALQRFMQHRRSQPQHPDFHITSSTILASTLHITRLNTRNQAPGNPDMGAGPAGFRPGMDQAMPGNGLAAPGLQPQMDNNNRDRPGNPMEIPGQADIRQAESGPNTGSMNSFSSLLLWILGGASSESFNSFLSMFRDVRDQGQVYPESPRPDNRGAQGSSAWKKPELRELLSINRNGNSSVIHDNLRGGGRRNRQSPPAQNQSSAERQVVQSKQHQEQPDFTPPLHSSPSTCLLLLLSAARPVSSSHRSRPPREGAKVSEDGVIETFENDDVALDAFHNGVVVSDLSHFGRIRVSGDDRVQFLHNQSTANFETLGEGKGCDTVFATATARTIDIAYAWIMKNSILLVVSPSTCETIAQMLNKYIFFSDNVEIQDITKKTSFFTIAGPKSNHVMENLNLGDLVGQPYGTHRHYSVNEMPITVGVGSLISEEGYSLLMPPAAAKSVWKTLVSEGAIPMGSNAWEKLRVTQGRPAPGKELTNEFNVLEACLWNSISQNKGCYKGQETIARLITYDGVKQRLWGINLSAPAEPGTPITVDGKKAGKLTSFTSGANGSEYYGLGYIKRQNVVEGSTVIVGDNIVGTVVEPPFLARQHPPSKPSV